MADFNAREAQRLCPKQDDAGQMRPCRNGEAVDGRGKFGHCFPQAKPPGVDDNSVSPSFGLKKKIPNGLRIALRRSSKFEAPRTIDALGVFGGPGRFAFGHGGFGRHRAFRAAAPGGEGFSGRAWLLS